MTHSNAVPLSWDINAAGRLVISRGDTPIMVVYPSDWLLERVRAVHLRRYVAWHRVSESGRTRRRIQYALSLQDGTVSLLDEHKRLAAIIRIEREAQGGLVLHCRTTADADRIGFQWWAPSAESLLGFGEYTDGPVRVGRFSTWTEEGPVGLGFLSRFLRWTGRVPFPRGHSATYAPVPSWLSTLNYAGWLDNTERIDWAIKGARRRLRVWADQFTLHLVSGSTLKDVIAARTAALGSPPDVPLWVLFPWIDAVRGEHAVLETTKRLRESAIPASAIWIEDWMGSHENNRRFWMRPLSHRLDRGLYPHFEEMANRLHQDGFKLLGYFCPEIAADTPLWREALAGGHLVKDSDNTPADILILGHHHGEPDLTSARTRQWFKERVLNEGLALGFDGWMADFGEYLPPAASLADGTSGWATHNRYPLLWQTLHHEFWETVRPSHDYTFFARSAALATHAVTPVMWGGDSDTDWDPADGLASVIPQALSAGLMGYALWATDIAGFMTFGFTRPSTRELYARWTELAALFPVMRTHHGTARPRNWHWWRDESSTRHFSTMARLHALLFFVFYTLLKESQSTGIPIIRPLCLEYSFMEASLNRQFLIGDTLLAAPALKPRQRQVLTPLPPAEWVEWWSGRRHRGPGSVQIAAPLGNPPLLVRVGSIIPLLEGMPNSAGESPGFVDTPLSGRGRDAVLGSVTLLMTGKPTPEPRAFTLPAGVLTAIPAPGQDNSPAACSVGSPQVTDHAPLLTLPGVRLELAPGEAPQVLAGLRLTWSGAAPLLVTVRTAHHPESSLILPPTAVGSARTGPGGRRPDA